MILRALNVAVCAGIGAAGGVMAAGLYDGTYSGTERVVAFNNFQGCSRSDPPMNIKVTVRDDNFAKSDAGAILHVVVDADGSFYATGLGSNFQIREIRGRIVDNALEADVGSARCTRHLSLKRS